MSVNTRLTLSHGLRMPAVQDSDGSAPTPKQEIHHTPPEHADHLPSSSLAKEVYGDDNELSTEEYLSFEGDSDSESETSEEGKTEEERQAEYDARELERQRVLAAAGLTLKHDTKSAPRAPARSRSLRTRRPAPAVPSQSSQSGKPAPERDLPPVPVHDDSTAGDPLLRVDDAFDRYEAYKQSLAHRTSIASASDPPSSPSASSLTLAHTTSREDNRSHGYSGLLSFLGRRTPVPDSDKRFNLNGLTISGPIANVPAPSPESGPAFGSVRNAFVSHINIKSYIILRIVLVELGRQSCFGWNSSRRTAQARGDLPYNNSYMALSDSIQAIFELIATESAYVRNLQLIVGVRMSLVSSS
jgi:actin cytoskeleton-regulatory complex protein PAN1